MDSIARTQLGFILGRQPIDIVVLTKFGMPFEKKTEKESK
jgi:hypothetical protein